MEDTECKAEFRLRIADISVLAEALAIPESFTCNQGSVIDGIEGLCVLLRRFSYLCRYSDLISRFGRPVPVLSMICGTVTDHIYPIHGHRITDYNRSILDPTLLQVYGNAVLTKDAALDHCFGFVDGRVRPICRPGEMQRTVYNGHKIVHSLKVQSVVLPNGLIANLCGPVGKYTFVCKLMRCGASVGDQMFLTAAGPFCHPTQLISIATVGRGGLSILINEAFAMLC